jgi:hypothetical protein
MPGERDVLVDIADSIAEGTPVDWSRAETWSDVSGKLGWLRVVEAISLAHREPPDETEAVERTAETSPLPLRWGPLVALERLGGGSRGTVYRARDTRLECDVALKLLKVESAAPEAVERFLDEGRRLARVHHPNVVVVHGADRHDGRPGLWAELLEGRTLEACLEAQGPFGPDEAARIGIDLCRALAAVHAAGLVHRDVKTSNVMRERGGVAGAHAGRIVLLDFSSVCERTTGEVAGGASGQSGTPLFMAPELLHGAEANARSDIYSLGVLLYRLVTGRYPVEATTLDELLARHARGGMRPLLDVRPDLPQGFVRVVERALDADPARRWSSPGEMERALSALVSPQPAPVEGRRAIGAPITALLGMAVVALVALAAWLIGRLPSTGAAPFEVEAQWFLARSGERLVPGARVTPGDGLSLEVRPSREAYMWVLNQDAQGEPVVVFPLEELDRGNPLAGKRRHRLPGTVGGAPWSWLVGNGGGIETFLVVASTTPLPEFEQWIEPLRRVGQGERSAEPPRPRLRGIDMIVPDASAQGATQNLSSLDAWLVSEYGPDYDEKIRVLKFQFDNAEP